MGVDLKLTVGERYSYVRALLVSPFSRRKLTLFSHSIITCLFFVPYVLLEPFANLTIRKVGCRNQLSGITILWGIVMLGMGWLKTWEQLAVCRVLLGIFESGFFPGTPPLFPSPSPSLLIFLSFQAAPSSSPLGTLVSRCRSAWLSST
jgi:MFS family permease